MKPRLLPEERNALVQQATQLAAALNCANGDSPDLTQAARERMMTRLRALSLVLWSDSHSVESPY